MPGFTPGRRWQPAYYPFHNDSFGQKVVEAGERTVKGLMFGCRMCGNCLLQETAFICPMECPKGLRNGPCGGSTPEHCYVDPSRPCIWYKIYLRSEKMGRTDHLLEVLPPLDWDKVGTGAWNDLFKHLKSLGGAKYLWQVAASPANTRSQAIEKFFYSLRQPNWWQGDSQPHPAPEHEPVSTLEKKLTEGQFVVTAEVSPPLAADQNDLIKRINALKEYVDAVNYTDNPSATPRMSSLASSVITLQNGVEPVMQIAARDYSRMSVQSTVLGAVALGICNILCLTGDHPRLGPTPHGRMDIWDLDSVQMTWMLRRMRDEGHFLDQRDIKSRLPIFLGAASSPNSSLPGFQAIRETKKVNAGAQFLQSNLIYDFDRFQEYMENMDRRGLLQRVYLLVGIAPIRSLKAAQMMDAIPGIRVPQAIMKRMEKAADPKEEGVQIALELIDKIKKMPGVHGIHFMSVSWESIVPRLITESGLREGKRK
jgi:5,10-methylenetetrahydrofolate reductase